MFDFTQANDELSVFVRDVPRYTTLVVQALRDAGLCAVFDGEEVAVKKTNGGVLAAAAVERVGDESAPSAAE